MSVVISPSVGRKVWYRPSKSDQTGPVPMQTATGQPLDATVIAVRKGRDIISIRRHRGADTMEVVGRVIEAIEASVPLPVNGIA